MKHYRASLSAVTKTAELCQKRWAATMQGDDWPICSGVGCWASGCSLLRRGQVVAFRCLRNEIGWFGLSFTTGLPGRSHQTPSTDCADISWEFLECICARVTVQTLIDLKMYKELRLFSLSPFRPFSLYLFFSCQTAWGKHFLAKIETCSTCTDASVHPV